MHVKKKGEMNHDHLEPDQDHFLLRVLVGLFWSALESNYGVKTLTNGSV